MKSEKGIAANDTLKTNLCAELTMKNNIPSQSKFQLDLPQPRKNLLELTKLSRLPELKNRSKVELPDIALTQPAVCVNCGGRLDPDDNIQQSVKVCRKCLTQYAVIDAAIDEASKRKRQAMLEKFVSGVND